QRKGNRRAFVAWIPPPACRGALMRIAYLCNRYPAVSLAFIQREVAALRELGMCIETMAVRRAFTDHILSGADRESFRSTFTVLPPRPAGLIAAHLRALVTR